MIYTSKYIRITQEILDHINKNDLFFKNKYPVLGELWKIDKESGYFPLLHNRSIIDISRGEDLMSLYLPKEFIPDIIEIKQIVNNIMNISELMVGDYVYCSEHRNTPCRIMNLNLDYINNKGSVKFLGYDSEADISTLQPIPLTPIILELNDFSQTFNDKVNGGDFIIYMSRDRRILINKLSNSSDDCWYCHIDNEDMETVGGADIQYVHELQHLYKLCNYNKPIFI